MVFLIITMIRVFCSGSLGSIVCRQSLLGDRVESGWEEKYMSDSQLADLLPVLHRQWISWGIVNTCSHWWHTSMACSCPLAFIQSLGWQPQAFPTAPRATLLLSHGVGGREVKTNEGTLNLQPQTNWIVLYSLGKA